MTSAGGVRKTAITRGANRPEEEKTLVCNYNIYRVNMYVCVRDREGCKCTFTERDTIIHTYSAIAKLVDR